MMKVEIWSDVMCPFCYIGKRRFEQALQHFGHQDEIEVEWKSFQLNPNMVTNPAISIDQYLADIKGFSIDHARQLNAHVTQMAAEEGLTYNFDHSVVANSFNAHRYSHFAKLHGKGIEAEEQLFKAYFTDGKNIDDPDTLVELGSAIGLNPDEVRQTIESDDFADDVKQDIAEAQHLGIQGVPFFVMNNKYGVSGAQPAEVFDEALGQVWDEFSASALR